MNKKQAKKRLEFLDMLYRLSPEQRKEYNDILIQFPALQWIDWEKEEKRKLKT